MPLGGTVPPRTELTPCPVALEVSVDEPAMALGFVAFPRTPPVVGCAAAAPVELYAVANCPNLRGDSSTHSSEPRRVSPPSNAAATSDLMMRTQIFRKEGQGQQDQRIPAKEATGLGP